VRVARAAVIMATVSVVASGCATSAQGHAGRASVAAQQGNLRVTSHGRLLNEFEALLRSKFGSKVVCERASGGPAVFVANGCTPLADYDPYFYTFSHPVNKVLRLTRRRPMDFGNYPRVVRVGKDSVRCNSGKHQRFLITYGDGASFSLTCQAPQ
jgi:hypothetical protein